MILKHSLTPLIRCSDEDRELFGLMVTSPLRPLFESRDHVFLIFVPLPSNSGPAGS